MKLATNKRPILVGAGRADRRKSPRLQVGRYYYVWMSVWMFVRSTWFNASGPVSSQQTSYETVGAAACICTYKRAEVSSLLHRYVAPNGSRYAVTVCQSV